MYFSFLLIFTIKYNKENRFLVAPHKKALQKCRTFLVCGGLVALSVPHSTAASVHKKGIFYERS